MSEISVPCKNGAAGWSVFVNRVLYAMNRRPGMVNHLSVGPSIDAQLSEAGDPVGVLSINDGAVLVTIRPGQCLVIPDRMSPQTWSVRADSKLG